MRLCVGEGVQGVVFVSDFLCVGEGVKCEGEFEWVHVSAGVNGSMEQAQAQINQQGILSILWLLEIPTQKAFIY